MEKTFLSGNGRWNEKSLLAISFPRLYALCNSKSEAVNEVWIHNSNDWNIKARRPLNDREIILWDSIKSLLPVPNPLRGTNIPIWLLNGNKGFTTDSTKKAVQDTQLHFGLDYLQIFEMIWSCAVPKKCKFFLWSVFHRKINTVEVTKK